MSAEGLNISPVSVSLASSGLKYLFVLMLLSYWTLNLRLLIQPLILDWTLMIAMSSSVVSLSSVGCWLPGDIIWLARVFSSNRIVFGWLLDIEVGVDSGLNSIPSARLFSYPQHAPILNDRIIQI